jgi:hypothetical protein
VLRATTNDLHPHSNTKLPGVTRNAIIIIGNEYHYEVLALNTDDGFQTVFNSDHPLIQALSFQSDNILDNDLYDPDSIFIRDFVEAFTSENGFLFPSKIYEIFPDPDDIFITRVNRLKPHIDNSSQLSHF